MLEFRGMINTGIEFGGKCLQLPREPSHSRADARTRRGGSRTPRSRPGARLNGLPRPDRCVPAGVLGPTRTTQSVALSARVRGVSTPGAWGLRARLPARRGLDAPLPPFPPFPPLPRNAELFAPQARPRRRTEPSRRAPTARPPFPPMGRRRRGLAAAVSDGGATRLPVSRTARRRTSRGCACSAGPGSPRSRRAAGLVVC